MKAPGNGRRNPYAPHAACYWHTRTGLGRATFPVISLRNNRPAARPMFSTALDACCEWRANRLRHIHRALETFCTSRRRSLFIFRSTSQSELQKALSGTKLNLQFIHTRKHIHSLIEVSRLMAYSTGCCRGTTG